MLPILHEAELPWGTAAGTPGTATPCTLHVASPEPVPCFRHACLGEDLPG